jgi:hypothetical protein
MGGRLEMNPVVNRGETAAVGGVAQLGAMHDITQARR